MRSSVVSQRTGRIATTKKGLLAETRSPLLTGCELLQIETICVHHLGPCCDEVTHELFLVVVLCIHLGI